MLANVMNDLQRNTILANNAVNFIQASQVRKRIDELNRQQKTLMDELVGMHPDAAAREKYNKLNDQVKALEKEIKTCNEMEALRDLESRIESRVGEYVHHFQIMMATLMGAPPPPSPQFGESS